MRQNILHTALSLVVILMVSSCTEEKDDILEFDLDSSRDHAQAESYWNDIFKTVDEVSRDTPGIKSITCIDTLIIDTLSSPRSIFIDFGDEDCLGQDGRTRRGGILVTYSDRYRAEGAVITVTPEDYHVNDYLVHGTKTVTNQGANEQGNLYFTVEVMDASISAPDDAWTSTWESTRTREWLEGEETLQVLDDMYSITGTSTGVNRNGLPFSVSTTEPLLVEIGCPWIVSGTIEMEPEDGITRSVDYGDGDCDNDAMVVINGNAYPIEL